jgi:hypothetical protein
MERQPCEYGHQLAFKFRKKKLPTHCLTETTRKLTRGCEISTHYGYFWQKLNSTFPYYPLWCMAMQHIGPRRKPNFLGDESLVQIFTWPS